VLRDGVQRESAIIACAIVNIRVRIRPRKLRDGITT